MKIKLIEVMVKYIYFYFFATSDDDRNKANTIIVVLNYKIFVKKKF